MKRLRAGPLRYLVTIEQLAGTQDSTGAVNKTWTTVDTAWASIESLGGFERQVADQIAAGANTRIRMRYRDGILPSMRVKYGDRIFDIIDPGDPDGMRRELSLICIERVESGNAGE